MDLSGGVLLAGPESVERRTGRRLANLIRVGGRLAVLGVEDGARAMGHWHVLRPGSFASPQGLSGQSDQQGDDLVYGRALCGRTVVSNGYAADWRPPAGQLCPACSEQI